MLSAYFNIHSDFPFRNANKFQLELFQVLKDDAVKVLHSICQQIWKTQQWPKTGKDQFSFQPQRKAMPKDVQITVQLHSFHMLAKLCSKILQARLQQYVNQELPDVQAGFTKARGTRDQIANICWMIEKAKEFQKNIYFCSIDYAKAFDCVQFQFNCSVMSDCLQPHESQHARPP